MFTTDGWLIGLNWVEGVAKEPQVPEGDAGPAGDAAADIPPEEDTAGPRTATIEPEPGTIGPGNGTKSPTNSAAGPTNGTKGPQDKTAVPTGGTKRPHTDAFGPTTAPEEPSETKTDPEEATDRDMPPTSDDSMPGDGIELAFVSPYCGVCGQAGCCDSTREGAACCGTYVAAVSNFNRQLILSSNTTELAPSGDESIQGTLLATNAPCTGKGVAALLSTQTCIPSLDLRLKGSCPPEGKRCTVTVLGTPLDDRRRQDEDATGGRKQGDKRGIKVDPRCMSSSITQVRRSGLGQCCTHCWTTCCSSVLEHVKQFRLREWAPLSAQAFKDDYMLTEKDPSLNLPAEGGCAPEDTRVNGSCCQQVERISSIMPLEVAHAQNCTVECSKRCGFQIVPMEFDRSVTWDSNDGFWCVKKLLRLVTITLGKPPQQVLERQYIRAASMKLAKRTPVGNATAKSTAKSTCGTQIGGEIIVGPGLC